jgi:hypothetical protein
MSGFIERVNISKMLLIQDMNLTGKFVGKTLQEINNIPLEGSLFCPSGQSSSSSSKINGLGI